MAPLGLLTAAGAAHAADVEFDDLAARAVLGEPLQFSVSIRTEEAPLRVELLTRLPDEETLTVQAADLTGGGPTYEAFVEVEGHTLPNTPIVYRFRVTTTNGEEIESAEETVTVTDERFEWRTLEGESVRVHWYEGDDALGERALAIGDDAVRRASDLLGVTENEPVDFFLYSDQEALYGALGPSTRENVGGMAIAGIRTMFGSIGAADIQSGWVENLVRHELTHLVFDSATENQYSLPAHWLDEGLAVYLAQGYIESDRLAVEAAAQEGRLIPLDGLVGSFPTGAGFVLGYAESVSAVDFFIRRHGEETLVRLIRSYADGVSNDEAFTAATGADMAAFDAAWAADLGAAVPAPLGPVPGSPGPLPPDWIASPGPGASPAPSPLAPGQTGPPAGTDGPDVPASAEPTDAPENPGTPAPTDRRNTLLPLLAAAAALAVAALAAWAVDRWDRQRAPRW